ncbi:hypothetical protein GCM10010439_69160 [Actinocorallia aurantiaca]|uniref:Uncharacterized protein n=1 Tax=Actinocorallia aurantiaca TaxID=46204 RepID=A0ABP6H8C0_9ACTN
MTYLVYRMKLSSRAGSDMRGFWNGLKGRERRCHSVIGGAYHSAPSTTEAGGARESRRSVRAGRREFLDTRIVTDLPVRAGLQHQNG